MAGPIGHAAARGQRLEAATGAPALTPPRRAQLLTGGLGISDKNNPACITSGEGVCGPAGS